MHLPFHSQSFTFLPEDEGGWVCLYVREELRLKVSENKDENTEQSRKLMAKISTRPS
jgi:hypothetical protein